ncbi:ABC transporter permease [Spirosoma knui]
MRSAPTPPPLAQGLLRWFCAPHLLDELEGDLNELFQERVESIGLRKARWRYVRDVVSLLRPQFIKRKDHEYPKPTNTDMLRNYLTIAFRNLAKNRASSAINIGGLAVGMAVAMLNGLWVWDELSFNKSFQNYNHIAQVRERGIRPDEGRNYSNNSLPYPLANELKTNYGQYFKHILLAQQPEECILTSGETKLTQKGQFIEAGAPDMFTLHMLSGSRSALNDRHSVLLAASAAQAMFGDEDPVNKPIKINDNIEATVAGVYADLPHNTAFSDIKFFAPFDLWVSVNPWVREQQWNNWFLDIYVQLHPQADAAQVSALIKDIELNKLKALEGTQELMARQPKISLLPMSRWHLYSNYYEDDNSPVQLVWLVGLIGLFVLLLACINFMNLSTARSARRAKEVGVRKAVGSQRGQLISQFFSESFLVVFMAFGLMLVLVILSLPWFNQIAAKELQLPWANGTFWLVSVGFILFTGFVAGSYPAFYLSSFQPVKVLKGVASIGASPVRRLVALPRQVLVVMQFVVSVSLIIGTLIVYRQVQYARDRPVGYDKAGLLLIEKKTAGYTGKFELLRTELKNTGVVEEVAQSRSSVTGITMWNPGFSRNGLEITCPHGCGTLPVSPEYGKTVSWQFVAGRDFNRALTSDSAGFVINESFARQMGLKNRNGGSPVGETIVWAPKGRAAKPYTILGVVKDMVALSPYEPTIPTVFFVEDNYTWINIRIKPTVSASAALPKLGAVFKQLIPSVPFDYKFADQEYALKFAAEERIGNLAAIFAVLAIFISCLGLFGLASFIAESRTKEIGIRKVLGASTTSLWGLLSKDFVLLVLIAIGIATPMAWFFLSKWLNQYQYHTELSWWIFALAGTLVLVITLLTVSYQSIKAALLNPVKSLRSE